MRLEGPTGKWISTRANAHLLICTAATEGDSEEKQRGKMRAASDARSDARADALHATGAAAAGHGGGLGSFVLSPRDKCLSSMARMYVYSRQRISKSSFDDPIWREAFQSAYEAGGGVGPVPFLTRHGLREWVVAEYETFLLYMQFVMSMLMDYHEGNPPAQLIHDCATLENHLKCMATGVEFVMPDPDNIPADVPRLEEDEVAAVAPGDKYTKPDVAPAEPKTAEPKTAKPPGSSEEEIKKEGRPNMAVCLAMLPVSDGTDETGAAQLQHDCKTVTGFSCEEIGHSTISDAAAVGIAAVATGHGGLTCK